MDARVRILSHRQVGKNVRALPCRLAAAVPAAGRQSPRSSPPPSGWCRQGWYILSAEGGPASACRGKSRGGGAGAAAGALGRSHTLWPQAAAEREETTPLPAAAPHRPRLSAAAGRASATMNHSPLKTALAYECFQDQDNSTLALPSDQKMKTGTSGRQRVQEQVMMTVKRQKSKSSQSSTLSHSNRGLCSPPCVPWAAGAQYSG
nr:uncharacterized protein LOC101788132 [Cavia porcellus]